MIEPVRFAGDSLELLDQRLLPAEERWITCSDAASVVEAIKTMVVRGAPAIGVAAGAGVALAARAGSGGGPDGLRAAVAEGVEALVAARPTAVNLAWAARRVAAAVDTALENGALPGDAAAAAWAAARAIRDADLAANKDIGRHGSMLVPDGARVLTHCNAGALATAGYGTALGVIRGAVEDGKKVTVIADETRPFLQGARLTAWELQQDGIPVVLITDNMAGALMAQGEIDLVVVGADRIAANGDVANKIGTYSVAVLARRHGIPFYVAAPTSTLDRDTPDGSAIPIEERDASEVTTIGGVRIAPEGITVRNPAFDVTPAELVTAFVTEKGIHRPPYARTLARALGIVEDEAQAGDAPGAETAAAAPVAVAAANVDDGSEGAEDADIGDEQEIF